MPLLWHTCHLRRAFSKGQCTKNRLVRSAHLKPSSHDPKSETLSHPTPPLLRNCKKQVAARSLCKVFVGVLQMGGSLRPPPPQPRRSCVMLARCKKNINGSKKPACSDCRRWFADGGGCAPPPTPLLFSNASAMKKTTYQRLQEASVF